MNSGTAVPSGQTLFTVKGLCKVFPNGKAALDGVDLDIYEGECLLIAGSNGSGKTVLMRILAGLLQATEGKVLYKGRPLGELPEKIFRQELGIVFQDPDAQFVGETAEEDAAFGPVNLGFDKKSAALRALDALKKTGLEEKRLFSPRRLSGGEKRRLAVAGVLAMGSRTVIMDEPFANLDWPGVIQVLGVIQSLRKEGKTLIILTHELEKVLALADRLVILDRGKLRESGPPGAVLDRLQDGYGVRDPRRSYTRVEDCSWADDTIPQFPGSAEKEP